jgi:hypothetical protein
MVPGKTLPSCLQRHVSIERDGILARRTIICQVCIITVVYTARERFIPSHCSLKIHTGNKNSY